MSGPDAMLVPFEGPYGGVPPFDAIDVKAFEPAIVKAIIACRAEIALIKSKRNCRPSTTPSLLTRTPGAPSSV
jgi:peptidyl-dipeptidase Dcp